MQKPSESTFQNKFITPSLRADGCLVQKFSDTVGLGIPDLLIGTRIRGGLWAEVKTIAYPASYRTQIKINWRPGQKRWLKFWNHQPLPTYVIIGYRMGDVEKSIYRWFVCPGHCLYHLDKMICKILNEVCFQGEVTFDKFKEAAILFERLLDTYGEAGL